MVQLIKSFLKYGIAFMLTLLVLFCFSIGTTLIPNSAIQKNMEDSADFMYDQPLYDRMVPTMRFSVVDYYADSLLLSIVYYLGDNDHPVQAAMLDRYYGYHNQYATQYLKESVQKNTQPNQEYLRYWHGSAAVMRGLHLICNVKGVYLFHGILLFLLILLLLYILCKNGFIIEGVGVVISLLFVDIWVVPFCLEYYWTFLVMLIASIIAVMLSIYEKRKYLGYLFLITGMVTVYLDFLTTETLTLLIPLLLTLRIQEKRIPKIHSDPVKLLNYCLIWLTGYVGMWVAKWILSSFILKIPVLDFVTEHVEERLGGDLGLSTGQYLIEAVTKNISMLSPIDYGIPGAIVFMTAIVLFVLIPIYRQTLSIRTHINKHLILLFLTIGLIPYLRYLVLHNHSWIHSHFTYRAQMATILSLFFIAGEIVEFRFGRRVIEDD